ncbi:hypothetical protein ACWF99_24825 [Nocardia sp. NPDC055002]
MTGPAVITPREQTAALAAALGEPLRSVELTRDRARTNLLERMPEAVVNQALSILGEPTPDEQTVSPDVERVLGRPATSYAAWAKYVSGAFR